MKRILSLFCAFVLALSVTPVALADQIDLSGMSFDELVALKDRIDLAIWNSQEWQEVEVPQGVWKVGEDIPVGHWTIKSVEGWASITVGTALNEGGKDIDTWNSRFYYYDSVYHPSYKSYNSASNKTELDFNLTEGMYIVIDMGVVSFSPYAGKPKLGFK